MVKMVDISGTSIHGVYKATFTSLRGTILYPLVMGKKWAYNVATPSYKMVYKPH